MASTFRRYKEFCWLNDELKRAGEPIMRLPAKKHIRSVDVEQRRADLQKALRVAVQGSIAEPLALFLGIMSEDRKANASTILKQASLKISDGKVVKHLVQEDGELVLREIANSIHAYKLEVVYLKDGSFLLSDSQSREMFAGRWKSKKEWGKTFLKTANT